MIGSHDDRASHQLSELPPFLLPPLLREGPLLLLEPHPDDAALSCAALLARRTPIDIFTVLLGRPLPPRQGSWDRLTGFASSAESLPARIVEEQAALAGTPHRVTFLDLLESEYLDRARGPEDARPLALAIRGWLEETGGGVVAVPAGAGRALRRTDRFLRRLGRRWALPSQHPDHLFVRDASLDVLAARSDFQVVLYEEFPYCWGAPADREVARVSRVRGRSAESIVVEVDRVAKAERIGAYVSQVPHLNAGRRRVDVPDDLPADERYWLLT